MLLRLKALWLNTAIFIGKFEQYLQDEYDKYCEEQWEEYSKEMEGAESLDNSETKGGGK